MERLEQFAVPPMPVDVKRPADVLVLQQQGAWSADTGKTPAAVTVKRDSESRVEVLKQGLRRFSSRWALNGTGRRLAVV